MQSLADEAVIALLLCCFLFCSSFLIWHDTHFLIPMQPRRSLPGTESTPAKVRHLLLPRELFDSQVDVCQTQALILSVYLSVCVSVYLSECLIV